MKNILKSLAYLFYYIFFQILVLMLFSIFKSLTGDITFETEMMNCILDNMLLLTIISNVLSIFILALIFMIRKKSFLKEIAFVKVGAGKYILPVTSAFCFSVSFGLITYKMQFNNTVQIAQSMEHYSQIIPGLGLIMEAVALLICAPLAEEVICRGIIITRLKRSFSDVIAIIISAIIFGVMHFMAGGVVLVISAMVVGIICGIAFLKTESLLPAIVAHMCGNLTDFILPVLPQIPDTVRYIFAMLCLVVSIVSVLFMCRDLKEK